MVGAEIGLDVDCESCVGESDEMFFFTVGLFAMVGAEVGLDVDCGVGESDKMHSLSGSSLPPNQ